MQRARSLTVRFALALLGAAWLLPSSPSHAEVYRYVDDAGVPHFTDSYESVPPRYRDQVGEVSETLGQRVINILPGLDRPLGAPAGPGEAAAPPPAPSGFEMPSELELLKGIGKFLLLVLVLLVPISVLITAAVLQLACKLVAPDVPGFGRACLVVLAQIGMGLVVGIALGVGIALVAGLEALDSAGANLVSAVVSLAVAAAIVSRMLDMSFPRGLGVAVVHALLCAVVVLVPALLFGVVFGGLGAAVGGAS